ncbi:MAG: hypothetical protein MUF43_08625 [Flavobacterium sp.]|nr:hypothetical protein [Flavobacterium sp.]
MIQIVKYKFEKATIIVVSVLVIIFLIIIFYSNYRNNLIENHGIVVPAKVIEIKNNVKKGVTTRENIVVFEYFVKNKKYKKSISYNVNEIVVIDFCFELKVIENSPEMALINLKKRIPCD